MTKSYLITLAKYNIWANKIVFNWLQQINDVQWNTALVSSFNSIAETAIHTAGAEKVWLERWQSIAEPVFLSNTFNGTKNELIEIWSEASIGILNFLEQLNEADLDSSFSFKRLNGDKHSAKVNESIIHVLNHSTYHRGQLVTLLRQVGFTSVSSTDMINYFREEL